MNTDTEILNKMIQAIQNYIGKIKEKNYGNFKKLQKIQHPFITTIIKKHFKLRIIENILKLGKVIKKKIYT